MKPQIRMAHFQMTQQCNLRCPFCGQWGKHGYAKSSELPARSELSAEEWIGIVEQIESFEKGSSRPPAIVAWGGEPLLFKGLDRVFSRVKDFASPSAIVSNGLLLAESAAMVGELFQTLYVSLDGPGEKHDSIRGRKGLHDAIARGMAALEGSKTSKVCLSTITEMNLSLLGEIALDAQRLGFDKIIFQNLIFILPEEQRRYDAWLAEAFGLKETRSASWTYERIPAFASELPRVLADMEARVERGDFKIAVEFHPLGIGSHNIAARMRGEDNFIKSGPSHCLAPFKHVNVSAFGEVRFCVDYNDVSLGSLRSMSLREILDSEPARRFREGIEAGRNPACSRCPWRRIEYENQ